MKKLLNILYITNPEYYLRKSGRNIVVSLHGETIARYPIHIFRQIICFNYMGVSPELMQMCMEESVTISFFTPYGKFCGRVMGATSGNIYTRKKQYAWSHGPEALEFSRNIIYAKAYNSRKILIRGKLDHANKVDIRRFDSVILSIKQSMIDMKQADNQDTLRGLEGNVARDYFSILGDLIVKQKEDFYMEERSKRPPKDCFNALLSFLYSILTSNIASALEGVGVDSYAGFFHTDRPGRASMALDIIEEMRAFLVDKFCLAMVNFGRIKRSDFEIKENGATLLNDKGRNMVLDFWNKKQQEEMIHPFTEEKIKVGLLPHVQAQLFNAYLRGDIEAYPPFMIK